MKTPMHTSTLWVSLLVSFAFIGMGCESGVRFGLKSQSEDFSQSITYNNKVDILFVVDNSNSMKDHQAELSRNVPDLINRLNALKMDYHIAVTSTTMSTDADRFPMTRQLLGSPKFLTNSNINALANRLLVGDTGSDSERGLLAMEYVLGENYLAANAPGFLRRDALLSVIFIGDEDDFSVNDVNYYENFLNNLKPPFKEGGRAWIANFIGVLKASTSCDTLGAHVSAGLRYIGLVDRSGGVKSSICERNLVPAVADIKARIVEILSAFRLDSEPKVDSIQVLINGVPVPKDAVDGWSYVKQVDTKGKTGHFIKFHGKSVPAADAVIKVNYDPVSAG